MIKKLTPYLILVAIAVAVFAPGLFSGKQIVSYDNKPTGQAIREHRLNESSFNRGWDSTTLSGNRANAVQPFSLRFFTMKLFSPIYNMKVTFFLSVLLAGLTFFLFLKSLGLSERAALFGGVALMLSNHFLTLILPGHLGKMMAFFWIPLVFMFLRKGVITEKVRHFVFAGFFLGNSFQAGGLQISFYFATLTVFYFLYLLIKHHTETNKIKELIQSKIKKAISLSLKYTTMIIMTIMVSAIIMPSIQNQSKTRTAEKSIRKTATQKWNWATQWSLPPEEIADFFLPGIFGWRNPGLYENITKETTYKYWGRLGRNVTHPKKFPNLRLASENMGLIVLLFFIFALFMRKKDTSKNEISFWVGVSFVALLLSMGRFLYIPYYLFFSLPKMDLIRNPNKIIFLITFAFPLVAAYGFDFFFNKFSGKLGKTKETNKFLTVSKYLSISLISLFIVSLFTAEPIVKSITGSWETANAASANIPLVFLIGTILSGIAYLLFRHTMSGKINSATLKKIAFIFIFLVAGELWLSSNKFIFFSDKFDLLYNKDQLINSLLSKKIPPRVIPSSKLGLHNGFKFHYYNINRFEISKIAKTDNQYSEFSKISSDNYKLISSINAAVRLNKQSINYLKSNYWNLDKLAQLQKILAKIPENDIKEFQLARKKLLEIAGVNYQLTAGQPTATTNSEFFSVLKDEAGRGIARNVNLTPIPGKRFFLTTAYRLVSNENEEQNWLTSTNYSANTALVSTKRAPGTKLNSITKQDTNPFSGTADLISYKNNRIVFNYKSDKKSIFVLRDKYDKDWKCYLDNKNVTVFPVNIINRGVIVPTGSHQLVFKYEPQASIYFLLTILGFLITAGFVIVHLIERKKTIKE